MKYQTIQQDLDLWEAWIEFDPLSPNNFGTLYIAGEVFIDKKAPHPFFIKCAQEDEPQTLILTVQVVASATLARTAEVVYAESLSNIDQYTSIEIYKDGQLLTRIHEIEVLV